MIMHIDNRELREMPRIFRANLVNSVTGSKAAILIGTRSRNGQSNLAIFSSVMHIGSDPALLAFHVRPSGEVPRHTLENIESTEIFTINHVNCNMVGQAHYTSAKFDREISEFEVCGLTEEFIQEFDAPFVLESRIKLGMRYKDKIHIKQNDTHLIIGSIEHILIPQNILDSTGNLDLVLAESASVIGLESYCSISKIAQFPFARPHQLPDFGKS